MKIILDKIGSVVKNANFSDEVELGDKIVSTEGAILAVEVLEDKKVYNQLELVSGRMSTLHKGDIIAVALGNRKALRGFVGKVPDAINVGETINVLNLGGVAGICTSENVQEVGHALKVKVLGAILKDNEPSNIKDYVLFKPLKDLDSCAKLIIVSGSCMHVGKTTVASEIIKHARRGGFKVMATKLSGVAALRDVETMIDYGAVNAVSFVDAGYPSTVACEDSITVAKGALKYLSDDNPDFIVIEFGDGIYGEYGVMDVLKDPQIQQYVVAHIGCAYDPPGALKMAEVCEEIGLPLTVMSGPISDNEVGVCFVEENIDVKAFNAFNSSEKLFSYLKEKCL
ncbi:hypothetical protein JKY72_02055 [Candidatus Gracilibacteria bacterium]|nr:hypothetical protein [Candidatus Gracilibacteria bacterium]